MRTIKTPFPLFYSICLFIISCNQVPGHHSDSDQSYIPGLHLRQGAKYYYTFRNESETKAAYNGKELESGNTAEIGLIYEILNDTTGGFWVKITYDKLHIVLNDKGVERVMDAGDISNDPVAKLLSSLRGASLKVLLDSSGKVISVSGTKDISDRILASMNTFDTETKNVVQNQMSRLIGEDFVKNNLEQGFKLFPDSAIYVGDSWKRAIRQYADIKMDAITTFTLSSIAGGMASISSKSEINNKGKTGATVMGYEVASDISGLEEGSYNVDIKTGIIIDGQSALQIEGTIQALGVKVPVSINISKTITTKKI